MNFVYKQMGPGSLIFYLYTPANLDSFGLVVENEEKVYFKVSAAQYRNKILFY